MQKLTALIPTGNEIHNIEAVIASVDFADEILVVESLKDYLKINTTSSRYIIHQTLSSFTEQLPSNNFIRINRSYTIAIDKIDSLEGNSIEIGGIRCVIGRTYIEEVKNRILKR